MRNGGDPTPPPGLIEQGGQQSDGADLRPQVRGPRLDRYELIAKLGEGGMATVFHAHDPRLGRSVALKVPKTNKLELQERFVREARITARCRHVNIVEIHELGEHAGSNFIVLEYLQGKPLRRLIEEADRMPYPQAIGIMIPLLCALERVHAAGVVHRDLKSDNIFMTDRGMPKLIDFGISKEFSGARDERAPASAGAGTSAQPRHTQNGMLVGTPYYMSPEQCGSGESVDQRTDIWACGVLLHQLICGRHPLSAMDGDPLRYTKLLDQPMPSMARAVPREVPQRLIDVIDRCLCKSKDDRWSSAADLRAALSPYVSDSVAVAAVGPPPRVSMELQATAPGLPSRVSMEFQVSIELQVAGEPSALARGSHASSSHASASPAVQSTVPSPLLPTRHKILCLASDSTGTDGSLRLGRQVDAICKELELSNARDRFEVVSQLIVEPLDLLRGLRKHKPTVVYFVSSGQESTEYRPGQALAGNRLGGVFVRGQNGRPQFLSPSVIQDTFGAAGQSVRLVLLSGCYVDLQAEALLMHVDCVVGTRGTVRPESSQAYAVGFMGALGEHASVATAHQQGCVAIHLLSMFGGEAPRLRVRAGIDASRMILTAMP